ncbi:hypothetical protein JCM19275_2150 [Nonlabens ulvanivorans]|uniref:Uncharacterized protein n=1 Tax=Nonlabens ulvanivorans TaxID=906888 RepID=A0A090WIL3_NONUL|nr:hypothetical protein JCM19275_2150 [Nonlabens ulvanivorans]
MSAFAKAEYIASSGNRYCKLLQELRNSIPSKKKKRSLMS